MEEKDSHTTELAPEQTGQTVNRFDYESVRMTGIIFGILSVVFMFISYDVGNDFLADFPVFGVKWLYFLHLLTASGFFLLAPWTRWALLATLTFDTYIMMVYPVYRDFLCFFRPITFHDIMTTPPMLKDAIFLSITVILYAICFIILVHPKLGRFTARREQFLREHARTLHGRWGRQ